MSSPSTSVAPVKTKVDETPFGHRNAALDGVRGIAILLVLVFHAVKLDPSTSLLDAIAYQLTMGMWCGVDLFFVLSGFLITGILLDSRGGQRYFTNFYARRTLRIFPLYYSVLILVFVIVPLAFFLMGKPLPQSEPPDGNYYLLLKNQFWAWTYLSNFIQAWGAHQLPGMGHFWTLAIEEQFYLLWPLCVFVMAPRMLLRFSIGLMLAVLAIRLGFYFYAAEIREMLVGWGWKSLNPDVTEFAGGAIRQLTFTRVDTLVMGGIGAMIVRDPAVFPRIKPWLGATMLVCAIGLGLVWFADGMFNFEYPAMVTIGYSLLAILCCSWLIRIWTSANKSRLLESGFLRTLGQYSYGLYVYHWPIKFFCMWLVGRMGLKTAAALGTGVVDGMIQVVLISILSLIAAFISWHVWEVHWLKLKKFFSYGKTKSPKAVAATSAAAPPETVEAP